MKIICKYDNLVGLTIGKAYDVTTVIEPVEDHFLIKDDSDKYNWWSKEFFDTLSEIRDEKLNRILK